MTSKIYDVSMQVSGRLALFRDPLSGSTAVSYPAPTYSAVKGMFESILYLKRAEVVPTKVHICRPIRWIDFSNIYSNPILDKTEQLQRGTSQRIFRRVLFDVVYQVFAEVRSLGRDINHAHSYQEQFKRRVRREQSYRPVTLGVSDFLARVGPVDPSVAPDSTVEVTIPLMTKRIFRVSNGQVDPEFYRDVQVRNGVLLYD